MPIAVEIEQYLFSLAPRDLAQSWDNVGLLVGDPQKEIKQVLVSLDITQAVVEEAIAGEYDLIVAHHPVMNCAWHPVQSIRDDDPQGHLLLTMARSGVVGICMHTNLDSTQNGVNDALARVLGLNDIAPLGEDGIGRIGTLTEPVDLADFAATVRDRLQANGVRYAVGNPRVQKIAVGGGACGEYAIQAAAKGCDTFVTADLKYHDFQQAESLGVNLIDAGHFPTEDVICPELVRWLSDKFPGLHVAKSQCHREVIQYL